MGVSKESISKFLIGNRFHAKLRILSPYSNKVTVLAPPTYMLLPPHICVRVLPCIYVSLVSAIFGKSTPLSVDVKEIIQNNST